MIMLCEGGSSGEQAAFDLFMVGKPGNAMDLGAEGSQDAFLVEVLQNREKYRVEARRSILAALRDTGYDGAVNIENEDPLALGLEGAAWSARYLRGLLPG